MTGGIGSLFEIAKSALATSQVALTVTGHNVANVNTTGYSRQTVVLSERPPIHGRPGMVGTGVYAASIRRSVDHFVEVQVTLSRQNMGRLSIAKDMLSRLQNIFGDGVSHGIAGGLTEFFRAIQDVATNPGELAARSAFLAKAVQLASNLNQAASDLAEARQSANFQVKQTVVEINGLSSRIAELNGKIVNAELMGQSANDLRDQRQQAVNELAEKIDLTTLEHATGAVSVYVARGQVLVDGETVRELTAVEEPGSQGLVSVGYSMGGTRALSINDLISNGRLRGLLDLRDVTIVELQRTFDLIAATLANAVNQIHRVGFGLNATTGLDVFSNPTVSTASAVANQGTASVQTGTVTAPSLLTFHDYEIRFSSPTVYSIIDRTTGSPVRGNYLGTSISAPSTDEPLSIVTGSNDTLTVTVDGVASGTVTLTGAAPPGRSYTSGAELATEIQTQINADATLQAAGKTVTVVFDTTTNRLVLTSNSTDSTSSVDVTGGTARSSLGLLAGLSTAASGTYTDPHTLNFDGISVTVTGTPAAGDILSVNSYEDAARAISVVLTDPASVAASSLRNGVPGNNVNMLALAGLQYRPFEHFGQGTLQDAYRRLAADFGVTVHSTDRDHQAQEILRDQIDAMRAQVSGVSLDEELVALIKFQRGFEAASRLIRVSDEMFQTILSLK
ncbi:MAG: flagellar hook-associated protein FlgK [Nitrospira sp.]|nr:flagellar hook-associated protein FlgK [Nitrospira sp.]